MSPRSIAVVFSLLVAVAVPARVLADNPTNGTILVLGDHVLPGQPFSITGYDIDPGIVLELEIANGDRTAALGRVTVAVDGTVNATANLPDDFPNGYANLTATSASDGQWATAVLVGERSEGPGTQDPTTAPIDDRVIGLTLAGIGTVLFVIAGAWYVSGRPKRPSSVD